MYLVYSVIAQIYFEKLKNCNDIKLPTFSKDSDHFDTFQNFEVLAREISIAGDKDNAGLMEWRKAFNMPKLFSDAIKNMNK